ncbi:MAG: beta-lactamase family protein [Pirellulales bacterium]|nr:beta-lactamase family protein [Pirellulales bacterium]
MRLLKSCIALSIAILILLSGTAMTIAQSSQVDYAAAIGKFQPVVEKALAEKDLEGVGVALVDDQRIVYVAGFGSAKKDSVFRAGSVSKLFNAVALMQLVEQGKLDLDQPIRNYGSEFSIVVPFENAGPITLRNILCHRSGMFRESPVGGYFDYRRPTLAETAASIRSCVMVNPPNTHTRYSNIAPSVAGQILVTVSGRDYEQYQQEHLLGPLGMKDSTFLSKNVPPGRLAPAKVHAADGRGGFIERDAPFFDLGTIPAGNLFATAEDLGRFVCMLAAGGKAGGTQILARESLEQMLTPQFLADGKFGLGFVVSGKYRNHKMVGHNGAIYGYSTVLNFLPDAKIGVVLLSNRDSVSGILDRLGGIAMGLMLEAKLGEKAPAPAPPPAPIRLTAEELAPFAGEYESPITWAHFEVQDGKLAGKASGHEVTLIPVEKRKFLICGSPADGGYATFEMNDAGKVAGLTAMQQKFLPVDPAAVSGTCPLWKSYLGMYGPDYIPFVVSVRNGHLYGMTENVADYRLTPVNRNVFAFPPGIYTDEYLVFLTDVDGKVLGVNLANMVLPRRD